ncbi:dihydrolipoyl dehydrogenase [Candidatus Profftella armatura (Diaphorina cf. continua)]|uniref:Dihydrolipoyl dehydrogenase n=1 Tax=Candidatus Profftella armatura (Diaphorina cf. continua) TaxID=2661583 RepID=A0A7R6VYJ4_9PROT|nr:dihydrolipoyl dehydrogenase [Candidatus Profftella armatura (Diaphorina cf. continua)]BCG49502.1 dihydrolipoyl dehydrogenase [Candidatus Profftella armatura (Diaphorina cf. continua)]
MNKNFDVIVIGAGPGGYVASIRSAQLGFKTACIDEWKDHAENFALGGTCTNVGCIPSKALLQTSNYFENTKNSFFEYGINIENIKLNLQKMLERKNNIIKQNNAGILFLFKKYKIKFFHGHATFTGKIYNDFYEIQIINKNKEIIITAKYIIIATGSNARSFPDVKFDENLILSNKGALEMVDVPKKLCIIGAGVIGLEIGSIWRRLGSKVTILEISSNFLNIVDEEISKKAYNLLTKQGLNIILNVKIHDIKINKKNILINYTNKSTNLKTEIITSIFDKLLISIGRIPNTNNLNIDKIGLKMNENNFIIVNDNCETNISNIYAIGDVVRGPMLAHKAEEEGIMVAEHISGQKHSINFNALPFVIYTLPEIASVGKTEQYLKKHNISYNVGIFPFLANSRARILGETSGMVKILSDMNSDEILGIHIIGPMASELISEAVMAIEFRASSEDIARICHVHPSLSEAIKEAAMSIENRSINY